MKQTNNDTVKLPKQPHPDNHKMVPPPNNDTTKLKDPK